MRHQTERRRLITYREHLKCPDCGGEVVATGHGMTRMMPEWEHKCENCCREDWFPDRYPRIVYEEEQK